MDTPSAASYDDIKASIDNELQTHYQRIVNSYRPDLKDDIPPHPLIFPHMNPCHIKESMERDRREFSVADLLTIKLQEGVNELPKRVIVLGRPESGKTALFAQIMHYWLHDKAKMKGLRDYELLLGVQCLGLSSVPSSDSNKTAVNLERHILDHLHETVNKYGECEVQQTLKKAKVLIIIDSLNFLEGNTLDEDTSLAPWKNGRVVLFCGYKFMKDNIKHPFNLEQSKEHLVLKLWGGLPINEFAPDDQTPESICDLGGVFSDKLLKEYCQRLCSNKRRDFDKFWDYYTTILKYLSSDMRKPFNIYMAMEAFCVHIDFKTETPYELYCKWFDIWSAAYECDSDKTTIISEGGSILARLAYEAFDSNSECFSCKDAVDEDSKVMPFLKHFLMCHYNPEGKVEKFTFRIGAHKLYFAAKQLVDRIKSDVGNVKLELYSENFKKLESILPMVLGVARGSIYNDQIKKLALQIAKHNLDDHATKVHHDPIINYAITILSEAKLYCKKENKFDEFLVELVKHFRPNNWTIVDGNVHPEALRGLCECGHDYDAANDRDTRIVPQRMNITLHGLSTDMPRICDLMTALKNCDVRICFSNELSFLSEGEFPLDEVISALHDAAKGTESSSKGGPSLSSFTGYIKDTKLFDAHPTTRRIYKLCLRITTNKEYEHLRDLCKISHKLKQVTLRISSKANLHEKKLKELPSSVAKLSVYLEGYSDESTEHAIKIWRSIQGTVQRDVGELRFWFTDKERMTPTAVKTLLKSDLPGTKIELSLEQPVSEFDKDELQQQLDSRKDDKYLIRLLGSIQYKRSDMKRNIK